MPAAAIQVREHGKRGPDVVVLHGGPGAQGSVASLAATLAPHYRALEPLQRRGGIMTPSVGSHIEDLAAVAPDRADYVGWSWGAMLGLSFAALHPERVKTLVLVGCGCYDETSREEHARRVRASLGDEGRARVADIRRRMERAEDVEWRDELLGQLGAVLENAQAVDPVGSTGADTMPDSAGHHATWEDAIRLQREGIEPERFTAISCPVLMLHGAEDPHPGHLIRDELQRFIPQLAYIEIPSCGHVPWYERRGRERFLSSLRQWLDAVG